ncbi:MAG: UDP-N-acetylmuramoyl-tripeptide--D-alanyl-D-alanine ligase [Mycobacteriales bacterium]
MIEMTLDEVAAAVGGRLDAVGASPGTVTTVTIDSRTVTAGALFVALAGEHVDGHDYAAAAVAAGAAGVLAERLVGVPAVVVDDVVVALGRLATAVLERLPELTVVAVTGSSGKTSTKDLLAAVLAPMGETVAPVGSYNNDIGHPLTVLRATLATRYLVLECSARGVGHIARLCRIAPPRIGVELNVGVAHIGEFGSREVIAAAKAELVQALPADGVAVLNADDPLVLAMADLTAARVLTVGRAATADLRAVDVTLDATGRPGFTLAGAVGHAPVQLALYGEHHVGNALAAAAVALELGGSLDEVAAVLSAATPASRWRMEVQTRPDGLTVVNDAYNANPDSMRAALKTLAAMAGGRRSWAVLGAMGELGDTADDAHDAMGRLVVRLGVSRLVVVGANAARLHAGATLEGSWGGESVLVEDVAAAIDLLRAELAPGDVVLVKASRAAGLERVAAALLAEPAQVPA